MPEPKSLAGTAAAAARSKLVLLGAPVDCGGARRGCLMGPDALRTAGLGATLTDLGYAIADRGNLADPGSGPGVSDIPPIHDLGAAAAWIDAIQNVAADPGLDDCVPLFLGGDHLVAAGSIPGLAARAARAGREFFVLWLDAHTDFHDLETTESGNLHGTPVAYFTGQGAFEDAYPAPVAQVSPHNVHMLGIRSIDVVERARIEASGIGVTDMRRVDEVGIGPPMRSFLARVGDAGGMLHVSLDIDFLDPSIAPAVGTTAPGGATFREAHLIMEMLCDSGLVTSLDIAELNPFLDEHGRTAVLIVDLIASLFGKTVLSRPTLSY